MKIIFIFCLFVWTLLTSHAFAGGHEDNSGSAAHSGHDAHGHQMTPEQLKVLRAKIPLYDIYTDEQIVMGMSRMQNLWGWMGEEGTRDGKIGILGLAHGFKEPGNSQFRNAFSETNKSFPATYALGMAMMSSDHIQDAITALEEAGAETIVVLPATTSDNSTLTRQWEYIFGRRDDSAYLDVPRVKASANLVFTDTPTAHPIMGEIMLDYAREKSMQPEKEVVVILGHGPQSAEDNAKELGLLAKHAKFIKQQGGFNDVIFANVQDDAPPDVRAGNVRDIRAQAEKARAKGLQIIAVTTNLTTSGITKRLEEDIGDIAVFNSKGLMLHPRFAAWIDDVVAGGLKN